MFDESKSGSGDAQETQEQPAQKDDTKNVAPLKYVPNRKSSLFRFNTRVKELEEKNRELKDKYLRLFAEFDNYKKRSAKEWLEKNKEAGKDVIRDLISVLDDFERAEKNIQSAQDKEALAEGFRLIQSKLLKILEQKGLEKMESIGQPFDTEKHEAITEIPAPSEDMKGKVLDDIEKGYLLNGKIIRYAKVVVGK
jgi:molecular chaperone GrpE